MSRLGVLIVLGFAGLSVAALADPGSSGNPSQQCRSEQADPNFAANHGKSFAQFYGANGNLANAFGKCVSAKAKAQSLSTSTTTSTTASASTTTTTSSTTTTPSGRSTSTAAALCRAERAAGAAAFKAKYGTNAHKSNGFGRCVSAKAKAQSGH